MESAQRGETAEDESSEAQQERRLRRKQSNRESARTARFRKKKHIEFLEARVAALSEEAAKLRKIAALAAPGFVDSSFPEAFNFCLKRLIDALANPLTTDEEFTNILEGDIELIGSQGKSRLETLSHTFSAMLELMLPKEHLFWVWLSKCGSERASALWSSLSSALSLSPEQVQSLQQFTAAISQESPAVVGTYGHMKDVIVKILKDATTLQSMMLDMRPVLTPRQCQYFVLWVVKYYMDLDTEKVLGVPKQPGKMEYKRSLPTDDDSQGQSDTEENPLTKEEKRLRRKQYNRDCARTSRIREKQRIESLETQVAALTEEAERLRKAAAAAAPGFVDSSFPEAFDFCLRQTIDALADPDTSDREFDEMIEQHAALVGSRGKSRLETLSRTFETTLELMFPRELAFCLWLSQLEPSTLEPLWRELSATMQLTQAQVCALQRFAASIAPESLAVQRTYSDMKREVGRVLETATALQTLQMQIRPVLSPRQCAHFLIWVHKYYTELDAEKVLAYGCSSSDLLSLGS